MAESLCCPFETITLLIGYTPIQNKKLKKKLSRGKEAVGVNVLGRWPSLGAWGGCQVSEGILMSQSCQVVTTETTWSA